jgi:ankyrin repeat protein
MLPDHVVRALEKEDTDLIRSALSGNLDVRAVESRGRTLLHLSFGYHPQLELARSLLQQGASVNTRDHEGQTPLHLVRDTGSHFADNIDEDCLAFARLYVAHGADINAQDSTGLTALHHAVNGALPDFGEFLVSQGASLEVRDDRGNTPLHVAVRQLSFNLRFGNLNTRRNDTWEQIIAFLLSKGANINTVDSQKQTPLYVAAEDGVVHVVKLLLKAGADANWLDESGRSAYQIALQNNRAAVAALLGPSGTDHRALQSPQEPRPSDLKDNSQRTGERTQQPVRRPSIKRESRKAKKRKRKDRLQNDTTPAIATETREPAPAPSDKMRRQYQELEKRKQAVEARLDKRARSREVLLAMGRLQDDPIAAQDERADQSEWGLIRREQEILLRSRSWWKRLLGANVW